MKSLLPILFLFISFATISSCKKDPATAPDMGYNYFPNDAGRYVIYNVDSTYYDHAADSSRNYKFQLKEKIESIYADNQNRPTIRLERYIKPYDPAVPYSAMTWHLRNVWAENRTTNTAEKVEDNVRYIKLAFPVKQNQVWDGNAQNTNGTQNYSYLFYDLPRTLGGTRFDSVLQVKQRDESSIINQIYYEEKYARNVGLAYKRVINVDSQPPNYSGPYASDSLVAYYAKPILSRATSGYQYTMTIAGYGKE